MNLLPDMIIIDFCEWLKHRISSQQEDLDFYDLMLNQEHRNVLNNYAEEYLYIQYYGTIIKKAFHRFIDSNDFNHCLIECEKHHVRDSFDVMDIYHCFRCMHFEDGLYRFLEKEYGYRNKSKNIDRFYYFEQHKIKPHELADSASYLFSNVRNDKWIQKEKKWVLQFINQVNLDVDIEADFLEWLIQTSGEPIDFRAMPLKTFEQLAERFQTECGKNAQEKNKLIKSFKQTNLIVLSEKLATVLPINTVKRARDLGYIFNRYQNKNVRFKCLIIPLQADSNEYIELMEKRWYDLHYLSADYLDIYYSKADYGKSGYQIANQMSYIPEKLKTKAPLIVLWENELRQAQGIDITRLDNTAVFEVIRCIVNAIREEKNIEQIVEVANQMSKELRDTQRPVSNITTNNTLTISGNAVVNGPIAVVNDHGKMVSNIGGENNDANVLHELEIAKSIISNFSEINDRQKQLITEIIDEARIAIKEDSAEKKDASKKNFKNAIDLIGIGSKLISALSGLVNVLKFFGISPV